MYRYEACPSNTLQPEANGSPRMSHDIATQVSTGPESGTAESDHTDHSPSSHVLRDRSASSQPLPAQGQGSQTFELSPASIKSRSRKDKWTAPLSKGYSRWETAWRLQTVIIGFYLAALALAVVHCLFFQYLDGRVVSPGVEISGRKTTTVQQGWVTTISILITTAFRAALVASVAVCYTQYLWATLRKRTFKVGLVEDLFQIQTNALHLTNPSVFLKTPLLAAVAIFCWLVPIATVYPPGTLVVELENSQIDAKFNVSVLHSKCFMDGTRIATLSRIWCEYGENKDSIVPLQSYKGNPAQDPSFVKTCNISWGNFNDVKYITRSSLITGEIAILSPPTTETSSYTIEFWGTTLDCDTVNRTISKSINETTVDITGGTSLHPAFGLANVSTDCELWSNENSHFLLDDAQIVYRTIRDSATYRYFPCLDNLEDTPMADQLIGNVSLPASGIHILLDVTETVCRPRLTKYSVDVSFAGGRQSISYRLDRDQPTPKFSTRFELFNGSYEQWVHLSDALSIYYEFAANLNRSTIVDWPQMFEFANSSSRSAPYAAENGTIIETCTLKTAKIIFSKTMHFREGHGAHEIEIWPMSIFERRYDVAKWKTNQLTFCAHFDPEIAKELLINSTISTLSLNKNFDTVNGTITRPFSVYRFRDKLAFYLPYGLAVGLSIPIIALGLIAFYKDNHGTSAITGGFLQLLMTTTGRTVLEQVVTDASTHGGHENVTKRLKETEITFGQLIEIEDDAAEKPNAINADSESTLRLSTLDDVALRTEDGLLREASEDANAAQSAGSGLKRRRVGFGVAAEIKRLG